MTHCQTHSPLQSIYERRLLFDYLLTETASPATNTALAPLAQKFRDFLDKKKDGRKTLATLLEANLNLSNAADMLHVHRNTLMFRLDQLQRITGLDPAHHFEDAVLCRILLEENK